MQRPRATTNPGVAQRLQERSERGDLADALQRARQLLARHVDASVDLLIVDDFARQPLDALDTADVYELIVERHRAAATVATSNREPIEWLGLMADALLAQSAIDRLQSAAYELILDGESYRHHQKPTTGGPGELNPPRRRARR